MNKQPLINMLNAVQSLVPPEEAPAISSYAQLQQEAIKAELRAEAAALTDLFNNGALSDQEIEAQFKTMCKERETRNQNTCLSYAVMPEGACNKLYWDIANLLFKPANLKEMLAILQPNVKKELVVELSRAEEGSPHHVKIALTLNEASIDGFDLPIQAPAQLNELIIHDGFIFNVKNIENFPFALHQKIKVYLDKKNPPLSHILYHWNDSFRALGADINTVLQKGRKPIEAFQAFIKVLEHAGEKYTGTKFASESAVTAMKDFFIYYNALPTDLREQLEKMETNSVLFLKIKQDLEQGNCTETTASSLKILIKDPKHTAVLNTLPQMTDAEMATIKKKYKSINVAQNNNMNVKIPDKWQVPLLEKITLNTAEDYINLITNLPTSAYEVFLKHATITCYPKLPDELAVAINDGLFSTEQRDGLFKALCANEEKFSLVEMLRFVLISNDESVREIVLARIGDKSQQLAVVREKDNNGNTLLHITALMDNVEVVTKLLALLPKTDRLAAINEKNNDGETVLHFAASEDRVEEVIKLLALIPEADRLAAINEKNNDGETVLHFAASEGRVEEVIKLLALIPEANRCAAVNEKDKYGKTVLQLDAFYGRVEVVTKLFALIPEADLLAAAKKMTLNTADDYINLIKNLPTSAYELFLKHATITCQPKLPDELAVAIKDGLFSTEQRDGLFKALCANEEKFSLVEMLRFVLISNYDESVLEIVLARIGDKSQQLAVVREKDNNGNTLLHIAAWLGHMEMMTKLLALLPKDERLAAINEKNIDGKTVLHLAASEDHVEDVIKLLALIPEANRWAAVNEKDKYGKTVSQLVAAHEGRMEEMTKLFALIPEADLLAAAKEMTLDTAEDYIDLITSIPTSAYEMFLKHATITCYEKLPDELAEAIKDGLFSTEQRDGLFKALCTNEEKFSLVETLRFVLISKDESALEILLAHIKDKNQQLAVVREKNKYGLTLLHIAANMGDVEVVTKLLALLPKSDRLAAVKEKDGSGRTVLQLAARRDNVKLVTKLLALLPKADRLAAVKEKNIHGETVLHIAAENGYMELVTMLLELYPKVDRLAAVKEKDNNGYTVLHDAARNGYMELVTMLLELYPEADRLAAIKEKNNRGETVLHSAAMLNYVKLVIKLLALILEADRLAAINEKNNDGETVLHYAVFSNNVEIVTILLALIPEANRCAAVNEKDKYGKTVLHLAVMRNNVELATKLLTLFPEADRLAAVKEKDKHGLMLLHCAAMKGIVGVATNLLALLPKADRLTAVKEKNNYGETPLHLATRHTKVMEELLVLLPKADRLAVVKEKNNRGETVLHFACMDGNVELVIMLLELYPEADRLTAVNEKSNAGNTVLHVAAIEDNVEAVTKLLALLPVADQWVALNEKDNQGETALAIMERSETLKNLIPPQPASSAGSMPRFFDSTEGKQDDFERAKSPRKGLSS